MEKSKHFLILVSIILFSCERKKEKSVWDDFYKVPYVISEKDKKYDEMIDSIANYFKLRYEDSVKNPSGLHRSSFEWLAPEDMRQFSSKDYGSGYGNLNVVFYNDKIFLHTKNLMFKCRSGSIPKMDQVDFIDLQPSDLTFIPGSSVQTLIDIRKSKLECLDSSYHLVTISSLSDTITSPHFEPLIDSVRKINPRFYIRRITEEEHHVLDAKTRNVPYDPKNYKWVMNYMWPPVE